MIVVVISLSIVGYLAAGIVIRPLLGRLPMFEDMVGFGPEDAEAADRGMAVLFAPLFVPLAMLMGFVVLLGAVSRRTHH